MAVIEACRLRLRPILMTSFAFILGVLPPGGLHRLGLRDAPGGRPSRCFFGMLGVTLFRADLHADLLHGGAQSRRRIEAEKKPEARAHHSHRPSRARLRDYWLTRNNWA